jgi:hypothetical protein
MKHIAESKLFFAWLQIAWGEREFQTGKQGMLPVEPIFEAGHAFSGDKDFVIVRV